MPFNSWAPQGHHFIFLNQSMPEIEAIEYHTFKCLTLANIQLIKLRNNNSKRAC